MLLSRLFSITALFRFGLAELDLGAIVSKTPQCAATCSLEILKGANCTIAEIDTCLCTNNKLQYKMAACVMSSCNLTQQLQSTTVLQELVCKGFPRDDRSREIIRITIILAVFTYPLVALRIITRKLVAQRIWWDDYATLASGIFMIPLTVLAIWGSHHGLGIHIWHVRAAYAIRLRQTYYGVQTLYAIIVTLSKISILLLYLRIFINPGFCRVIKILIALIFGHGVIYVACIIFQCVPISSIWTLEPARCLSQSAMVYSGAGLSIMEDFILMLLPICELRKLNMSVQKKFALAFIFALGSFASFTGILRLRYLAQFGNSLDASWDNVDVIIWSLIELSTAIICVCLICLRPLLKHFFPSSPITTQHTSGTYSTRNNRNSQWQPSEWSPLPFARRMKHKNDGMTTIASNISGEDTLVSLHRGKEEHMLEETPMRDLEHRDYNQVWVIHSTEVDSCSRGLDESTNFSRHVGYYATTTHIEADPSVSRDGGRPTGRSLSLKRPSPGVERDLSRPRSKSVSNIQLPVIEPLADTDSSTENYRSISNTGDDEERNPKLALSPGGSKAASEVMKEEEWNPEVDLQRAISFTKSVKSMKSLRSLKSFGSVRGASIARSKSASEREKT